MSTRDKVIDVISDTLEIPREEVNVESHFITDLGANSLDIVNLIWRIEDEFALGETPESVLEEIATVGQLVELVDAMRSGEPSEGVELVDLAIASDHAGIDLKAEMVEWLRERQFTTLDLGPADAQSVDYPGFAELLSQRVARGEARRGVLICGTGIGMSIAANKIPGIRAARVCDPLSARLTRRHNDANVLCLGSRIIGVETARACLEEFLNTPFDPGDDGRHQRRVQMLSDLERQG